jgi:protein-disulfide isomerase
LRQINEAYIDNGLVRFGLVHFIVLGPQAAFAAEASECAADQGAFWQYHDEIFLYQSQYALTAENLKMHAQNIGLDTDVFNACLDSRKHQDQIIADTRFAQSVGMRSTPSFMINGQQFIGAQPFENFQQVIDALLN